MKGKVILASYYDVESYKNCDIVVNIARGNMEFNGKPIPKRIALAPSQNLFKWYQANKKNEGWFDKYRKVYLNELKNNKIALDMLTNMRKVLDSGKDICLLCFCKSYTNCHRGILGDLFKAKGYEVEYRVTNKF